MSLPALTAWTARQSRNKTTPATVTETRTASGAATSTGMISASRGTAQQGLAKPERRTDRGGEADYRHPPPIFEPERNRCPVCHHSVYSLAGIHPQGAKRLVGPPKPRNKAKVVEATVTGGGFPLVGQTNTKTQSAASAGSTKTLDRLPTV